MCWIKEGGSKPQPGTGLIQSPTGIPLCSWGSSISSASAAAPVCWSPQYPCLIILKNKIKSVCTKTLKLCSSIQSWRTGTPHHLPDGLWQLECLARGSTGKAAEEESLCAQLAMPSHPCRHSLQFTCFQFVDDFLIWGRELWWQGLVWRSCGREQISLHQELHEKRSPCSLAYEALLLWCTSQILC